MDENQLTEVLLNADVIIGYTPIGAEPNYGAFLKEKGITKSGMSVLADRGTSSESFAESLFRMHAGKKVCIFIPGREFDVTGTRHGRGGGWYDRFLSAVPRQWFRIGVLNAAELSKETLKREAWDEPMDALLLKDQLAWRLFPVREA